MNLIGPALRLLLPVALLSTFGGAAVGAIAPPGPATEKAACVDTQRVLSAFLAAVDRGELSLFGVQLTRDDLAPVRVELVLEIGCGLTSKNVYSKLKTPFPCPGYPGFSVDGITATLTEDDRIGETAAHLCPN